MKNDGLDLKNDSSRTGMEVLREIKDNADMRKPFVDLVVGRLALIFRMIHLGCVHQTFTLL